MAIKLGDGGGGANIPYKGSTAEAAHASVTEGSYYQLNSSGKLVDATAAVAETPLIDQSILSQTHGGTAGWSSKDAIPFGFGSKFEGLMPNGNILYLFGRTNGSGAYLSVAYVVLDSKGEELSYVDSYPQDATYYSPRYKLQFQGEDSTHYIFTAYTHGSNSNSSYSTLRGYTVTVRKSDNAITVTANSDLAYVLNSSIKTTASKNYGGELTFARDKSVYCSVAISTAVSSSNMTLELTTGTVGSAYAQSNVGTTTIASIYSSYNIQLIKYDDSSANFLLAYQTITGNTSTGYVVKKVLVAADGTHTVTDITPSGFSQGTGSTQQYANWSCLLESEQTGKYLWSSVPYYHIIKYQKVSYDGSSLTVDSVQQYQSSNNFIISLQISALYSIYSSSRIYRYGEDKLYIAPRGTHSSWSGYADGAVWVLGSGNKTNTAVKTDLFDSLSKEFLSNYQSLISINYSTGLITERVDTYDTYVKGLTSQLFDTSPKTKDKIAYVRQSGSKGDTVNISLLEGVTSSETLSSTYWLNKEDMYYSLDNSVVISPAFSYLKPTAYLFSNVQPSTVNAVTFGENALTVSAPTGKYLKIESYYSTAAQQLGLKIDGAIFTEYTGTPSTTDSTSSYRTILNGNSSGGPSIAAPILCKELSIYRTYSSNISGTTYLTYSIGEPA